MTNEQQAETTGFLAFDTVLTHWNGTWNANVATGAMVTDFRNAKKKNAELAIASGADNS